MRESTPTPQAAPEPRWTVANSDTWLSSTGAPASAVPTPESTAKAAEIKRIFG